MDGKQQLAQGISSESLRHPSSMSSISRLRRFLLPMLAIILLLRGVYDISYRYKFAGPGITHLVPLEAHIISKCPDTRVSATAHRQQAYPVSARLLLILRLGCFEGADPSCDAAGV